MLAELSTSEIRIHIPHYVAHHTSKYRDIPSYNTVCPPCDFAILMCFLITASNPQPLSGKHKIKSENSTGIESSHVYLQFSSPSSNIACHMMPRFFPHLHNECVHQTPHISTVIIDQNPQFNRWVCAPVSVGLRILDGFIDQQNFTIVLDLYTASPCKYHHYWLDLMVQNAPLSHENSKDDCSSRQASVCYRVLQPPISDIANRQIGVVIITIARTIN